MSKMNFSDPAGFPSLQMLEAELKRERKKKSFRSILGSTVFTLVIVAALAILVATLWLPVLRIYGTSMAPTLREGNLVVTLKESRLETGDIIAFYYNNKILVKRVIAGPGDWVNIEKDGTIFVNNAELDEPYLVDKAFGECDIPLPYQVPDGRFFVCGDNRSVSVDSRSRTVGCVADEQIVGKLAVCIWPTADFHLIWERR